jgi:hypothetical protein
MIAPRSMLSWNSLETYRHEVCGAFQHACGCISVVMQRPACPAVTNLALVQANALNDDPTCNI